MGSENARKIIQVTNEKPLSASEISKTCSIPLTKVYQWLRRLENCKLLRPTGVINEEGRRIRLYKSMVNMIMIDPTETSSPRVEILGSGKIIKCSKCGSANCTLVYDKSNKTTAQCIDCKTKYVETISHSLKEEKQKFIILEGLSDSHSIKEEQQKVFILGALLEEGKSKSK